jgi:tRNA threonylcarbamoyladenosine biosynthesis protein TsaB
VLTLALETSTSRGSVAWGDAQGVRREVFLQEAQRPSETLFTALTELGVQREPIVRIVVGLGPGSFSGIRVAIAAAYGLAAVSSVPVWGVCSAYSVGRQFPQVTRLGVLADAKRGEFYATIFARGELVRAPFLLSAEGLEAELGKVTLAVSAEPLASVPERAWPKASDFLSLPDDSPLWVHDENLEPIYLRTAVKVSP